jgi:hypothetical protein
MNEGAVFMEKRNGGIDRIRVTTKEGFTLNIIGTNVVEGAVYLIRMYEAILKKLENGEIPEGVESAEIEVEGIQEEYALAASPLHIKCRLPNLANIHESDLDRAVEEALNRALGKKRFQVQVFPKLLR